ncbi:unnamed protein product [Peniophora sp. CBMAI 1063]|nr:unnamed protein product [Peniophora sp. CBMAI 1063]
MASPPPSHSRRRDNLIRDGEGALRTVVEGVGVAAAVTENVPYLGVISAIVSEVFKIHSEISSARSKHRLVLDLAQKLKSVVEKTHDYYKNTGPEGSELSLKMASALKGFESSISATLATLTAFNLTSRSFKGRAREVLNRTALLSALEDSRVGLYDAVHVFNLEIMSINMEMVIDVHHRLLQGPPRIGYGGLSTANLPNPQPAVSAGRMNVNALMREPSISRSVLQLDDVPDALRPSLQTFMSDVNSYLDSITRRQSWSSPAIISWDAFNDTARNSARDDSATSTRNSTEGCHVQPCSSTHSLVQTSGLGGVGSNLARNGGVAEEQELAANLNVVPIASGEAVWPDGVERGNGESTTTRNVGHGQTCTCHGPGRKPSVGEWQWLSRCTKYGPVNPHERLDAIPLAFQVGGAITAARRRDDGALVVMKIVKKDAHPNELKILLFLSEIKDSRNYNVPILDSFDVPVDPTLTITVLPLLRRADDPPFETVWEVVECIRQLLEGLQFMHEHNIAHRDCFWPDIMMDASWMCMRPFHPANPERSGDWRGLAKHISRTETFMRTGKHVKYFFVDMGISRHSEGHDPICGNLRELPTVPGDGFVLEHQDARNNTPSDLFATDVYLLGNTIRERFLRASGKLSFLEDLVSLMTTDDPRARPRIGEVAVLFSRLTLEKAELDSPLVSTRRVKRRAPVPAQTSSLVSSSVPPPAMFATTSRQAVKCHVSASSAPGSKALQGNHDVKERKQRRRRMQADKQTLTPQGQASRAGRRRKRE